MKRLVWLIVILLILLLLLFLFLFFLPKAETVDNKNLAFPESGVAPRTIGDEDQEVLAGNENFRLSVVRSGSAPAVSTSQSASRDSGQTPQNSLVQYEAPTPVPFVPPTITATENTNPLPPLRLVRRSATSSNSSILPPNLTNGGSYYIPPVVPPPYPTAYYIPPPPGTTETVVVGRTRDGIDIRFNPQSGDLFVGDLHFNFAGANAMPGSTSDVVGDPDNLTLGTTIGTLVGSLIGDPGLGVILGTALGSNLYSGFTLQDLGIGLQDNMLTLGGENILASVLGDSAIGGALESITGGLGGITGGLGGGNSYFGGKGIFAAMCTCSGNSYVWTVTNPAQYAGTYLYSLGSSKQYANYAFVGVLNAVGSYSTGEGTGECLMTASPCIEVPITKGKINSQPGVGSTFGF